MRSQIILLALLLSIFSCSLGSLQRSDTPAEESTAPFSEVDFKGKDVYVTLDNVQYKWIKLDTTDVSKLVDLFKENYSNKWKKRFSEDLVEYLNKLEVYPAQRESFTLEDEAGNLKVVSLNFNGKKRNLAKDHYESTYEKKVDVNLNLTKADATEDLEQLHDLIQEKYSYYFLNEVNIPAEIRQLKEGLPDHITTYDLAFRIGKFLNKFGDGHTRVHNVNFKRAGMLPFSVSAYNGKVICTKEGKLLKEGFPFLHSINGIGVVELLKISEENLTQAASPQFIVSMRAARINRIGEILRIAGVSTSSLTVELISDEGEITSLTQEMGTYVRNRGIPTSPLEIEKFADIGYLKIKSMAALSEGDLFAGPLSELANSRAIIIDVRGNGGGLRDILIELAPHFISKEQGAVIGNVAQLRTNNTKKDHDLSDRYLYQANADFFDEDAKRKVKAWSSNFTKSVTPEEDLYSADYFLYIKGHDKPKFPHTPTVVLMNEGCYSATDIFLSTFKEIDDVTLVGTPSGGGSGRSIKYQLQNSRIEVRLSSIVSFQPNGDLYDGNGVQPDIEVEPFGVKDFLKETDSQLEQALNLLEYNPE
ncbi:MAG: S41 family peptidase [Saprospiraceae bacterium]